MPTPRPERSAYMRCPMRLSYKTVDSYIEKLRAIFHSIGRDGEWDKRLVLGNPAADKTVKDYLRVVAAEQLQARITPEQATPFFIDKLTQLSLHLDRKLSPKNLLISLLSHVTRLTLRWPFSAVTDQVKESPKSFNCPMMMVFSSIMCGGKPLSYI